MSFSDCPRCGFYNCSCSRDDLERYHDRHRFSMGFDRERDMEKRIEDMRWEERREELRREEEEEERRIEAAIRRRQEEEREYEQYMAEQNAQYEEEHAEPEPEQEEEGLHEK